MVGSTAEPRIIAEQTG